MKLDFWNNKKREIIREYRVYYRAKVKALADSHEYERRLEYFRGLLHEHEWAYNAYESEWHKMKKSWSDFCRFRDKCDSLRGQFR